MMKGEKMGLDVGKLIARASRVAINLSLPLQRCGVSSVRLKSEECGDRGSMHEDV